MGGTSCSRCQQRAQERANCVGDDCLRYGVQQLASKQAKATHKNMNIQLDSFKGTPAYAKLLVRYKARQPRDITRGNDSKKALGYWHYGEVGFIPLIDFATLKTIFELAPSMFWAEFGIASNNPAVSNGDNVGEAIKKIPAKARKAPLAVTVGDTKIVPTSTEVLEFNDEEEDGDELELEVNPADFLGINEDAYDDNGDDFQLSLEEQFGAELEDEDEVAPVQAPVGRKAGRPKAVK